MFGFLHSINCRRAASSELTPEPERILHTNNNPITQLLPNIPLAALESKPKVAVHMLSEAIFAR